MDAHSGRVSNLSAAHGAGLDRRRSISICRHERRRRLAQATGNGNANAHTNTDGNRKCNANSNNLCHGDPNRHTNSYANVNTCCHRHTHRYAENHADPEVWANTTDPPDPFAAAINSGGTVRVTSSIATRRVGSATPIFPCAE